MCVIAFASVDLFTLPAGINGRRCSELATHPIEKGVLVNFHLIKALCIIPIRFAVM